jgi:ABC-type sugar transport system ATPase subunit
VVSLKGVSAEAGEFQLRDISFDIPSENYCCLMGRTGSGKTTIMETICGLRQIKSGSISIGGVDVTGFRPAARGIGFVPQDGALFSTMTVFEQLAFALRIRKQNRSEIDKRVRSLARLLGISHLLDRSSDGLSGGERQCVALGRALSFYPSVLCLDEPLSSLDDETREGMIHLLRTIRREARVTVLHITHSFAEARRLADCFLYLDKGSTRSVDEVELGLIQESLCGAKV